MAGRRAHPRRILAAICLAAGLALAGCGGHGHLGASAIVTDRAPAAVTTTSSSTAQAGLPGHGRPTVTIGDKNYTEQFVLGQLYLQALRGQGFTVNISQNIGPPAVFSRALAQGTLAMYPEYLSTFDTTFAHVRHPHGGRAGALATGRRWARRHGLRLLSPTPFSDTNAIAVTVAYAQTHRLRTLSDLRRVGAGLALGGAAQFANASPGLPTLSDVYGVVPASFSSLGVGDQYGKLDSGSVQAAYVNTSDGQLVGGDYRVLGDPRRIFGYGNVVPVVSRAALVREGPAFAITIERVDRTLTLNAMRALNADVDVAGQSPASAATRFLETHGLLDPLPQRSG